MFMKTNVQVIICLPNNKDFKNRRCIIGINVIVENNTFNTATNE